jgi:TonB family protein
MAQLRADGPAEVRFLFEDTQKRAGGAFGASLAIHAAAIALGFYIAAHPGALTDATALLPESLNKEIVWLAEPGAGGGGGGGGNESPEPPREAEVPGKEKITVPVLEKSLVPDPKSAKEEPPPRQDLNIPAQTLASSDVFVMGVMEGAPTGASQGAGTGGGGGTGSGTGIGSGQGSGLGAGFGGGTGGGAYRPGNGVTTPVLRQEVKPQYTADAMRAKIQGVVVVECVVNTDGTVGKAEVIRSLDRNFGLDQEALKAVRQWRFDPGMRQGQPVPVLVSIELTFTLR